MDKILTTSSYGICLFSMESLQDFLKKEKIKSKKLLAFFQKNKKRYLFTQKEGIWVPISQINSIKYHIKLKGYDEAFDDEWEQRLEYGGFNLEVKDGLWISSIGSFLEFDAGKYTGSGETYKSSYGIMHYFSNKERWYQTLDGYKLYTDFKYDVPAGKYLLSVKGYARKEIVDRRAVNYGFQFELRKVDEFDGYKNPREEQYDFNVAEMK